MSFVDFTFSGRHSRRNMGLYSELVSRPLFPEPKTVFQEIPGVDGEMDFSENNPKERICFKPRIIEFECHASAYIEDVSMPALFDNIVSSLFNGEGKLILDCDPDVFYKARVANLFNLTHITDQSVSFPLIFRCDPFRYSHTETVIENDGLFEFENSGYYTPFVLEVTGDAPNGFYITELGNNPKSLYVNTPLDNATAIINTETMDVTIGGISVLSKCSGNFPELSPGQNQFTVGDADGNSLSCRLKYRERYL